MDKDTPAKSNSRGPDRVDEPSLESPTSIDIPNHQLLRCIGRGSYGEVWLARSSMGMYRAVKIVYRRSFDSARPFERELSGIRKFEPISRSHEGFMDVLHVGLNDAHGCFFYIMELGDDEVSGQQIDPERYAPKTLAKAISSRGRLTFQECLELGLALSQALAELHKHGLVHRDVKPSNIIFVNGVPKLADIGLVAEVSEARSYVGTEGFIPPEGPGAPPADIFGLGKVLYEVSTGKDRQEFPELPTLLDEFPDRDRFLELNEVVLQACKNEPTARYHSAWDLQADLLVLANGKSVKRLKVLEQRLTRLKRGIGVAAVVLALASGITYHFYREWRFAGEARQKRVGASIAYGNNALNSGDLLGALPFFVDALRLDERNSSEQINHRLRIGATLAQCPKVTHLWQTGVSVMYGRFSPDGLRVAITKLNGEVEVYDLATGQRSGPTFGPKRWMRTASFSHDGRYILTAGEDGVVGMWDAVQFTHVRSVKHPELAASAMFDRTGKRFLTACADGRVRVWDAATGRTNLTIVASTNALEFATFSPDEKFIATASRDRSARVWDAVTGQPVGEPLRHENWVTYVAFSADGRKLLTASFDRKARLWDLATGQRIRPDMNHGDGVESVEFSPDGALILTGSLDGTARLWSADTLLPVEANAVLRHGERVMHAAFSPEGRQILVTCADGTVRIWDLAGCSPLPPSTRLAVSSNGERIVTLTNNALQVWDSRSGAAVSPPFAQGLRVGKAELNADGRYALSISGLQTNSPAIREAYVWDVASGKQLTPAILITNTAGGATLSRDGRHLAVFGGDLVRLWQVQTQTLDFPTLSFRAKAETVRFSPDGGRLVTISGRQAEIWNSTNGSPTIKPLTNSMFIGCTEFSSDGAYLLVGYKNGVLDKCDAQIWDPVTGKTIGPPLKHDDGVLFACFSPDNQRVATTSEDFTARIWDVATGRQLIPIIAHGNQVQTATFSPDGKWLITASSDRSARVWNASTGDPLTPPLRHLTPLGGAQLLASQRDVAAHDTRGNAWIWQLPIEERPIVDLQQLAGLLSGTSAKPAEGQTVSQTEPTHVVLQRLQAKYPASFRTSPEEITAWHEFEARKNEADKRWDAAVFHLQWLLNNHPADAALTQRLVRAEELASSTVRP